MVTYLYMFLIESVFISELLGGEISPQNSQIPP